MSTEKPLLVGHPQRGHVPRNRAVGYDDLLQRPLRHFVCGVGSNWKEGRQHPKRNSYLKPPVSFSIFGTVRRRKHKPASAPKIGPALRFHPVTLFSTRVSRSSVLILPAISAGWRIA